MIKVLKENEDMKRTIEHYERLSSHAGCLKKFET